MTRRQYIRLGAILMAAKYAGDCLLVGVATGRFWTPFDYFNSLLFALSPKLTAAGTPQWLLLAMGLWVIPFVLVGIRLTMRRAVDAGRTPWIALAFFVPFVNYALMAVMAALPSKQGSASSSASRAIPRQRMGQTPVTLIAAVCAGLLGPAMVGICAYMLQTYGVALFVGTPYVIGVISGYVVQRLRPESSRTEAHVASLIALALIVVSVLVMALEGFVCLMMALPLAIPLVSFGAAAGHAMGGGSADRPSGLAFGVVAIPLAALIDPTHGTRPVAREVFTAIEINAPPDAVWPHVIAFEPLPESTDVFAKLGVAYPKSARIAGSGVGAVRFCEFSTGAFVEPITAWEAGQRLAFDVTSSPPPMREWSPYANIHPPHLDNFLRSRRGEFRLVALPGGRTRLEGRTWYELDMAPEWYWRVYGDWFIHRIHTRVLEHIQQLTTGK